MSRLRRGVFAACVLALVLVADAEHDPNTTRVAFDELGIAVSVPRTWGPAHRSPLQFDEELAPPDRGGPFLGATRQIAWATDLQDLPTSTENQTVEHVTVDGFDALDLTYTGPRPVAGDPGHVDRIRQVVIDARDGTWAIVSVGGDDEDLTRRIVASIEVGAVDLGITTTELTVARDGLVGRYHAPPGTERRPAVLVLGGSEGGVPSIVGTQLARIGYPALELGYFGVEGLPDQLRDIPLEYFERALRWLGDRPEADSERLVVWGASRGGEASLLIGSTFPELVAAVVANVPSNRVQPAYPGAGDAWTLDGETIPQAEIAVERIDGPVLMTCGERDQTWPSCDMSRAAMDRLEAAGHPHHRELVAIADEGHFVNRVSTTIVGDPRESGDRAWHTALDFLWELRRG